MTDEDFQILAKLESLNRLTLSKCPQIHDGRLPYLFSLKKMTHLKLIDCKLLSDQGLQTISTFVSLTSLDLSTTSDDSQITDTGISHLKGLKNLKILQLCGRNGFTNKGLEQLSGLVHLSYLKIKDCRQITLENVKMLKSSHAQKVQEYQKECFLQYLCQMSLGFDSLKTTPKVIFSLITDYAFDNPTDILRVEPALK
jgi:hypothetical protein